MSKLEKYATYKDSGVEWLGEIPEHWEIMKTTHAFNKIGSGTTPTSTDTKYYDGEINWLQTGDLTDNIISETSKKITYKALKDFSTLKIYPKNSLVIAMYGATIGKAGILDIETATNQACCVLSNAKQILEKYAFYWFLASKNNIISMGYGGGQPNISQDLIKSLRMTIPPKDEQTKIASFLDEKTSQIDKAISQKEKLIELLKEERQIIINEAVTKGLDKDVEFKDSGVEWIGKIPKHWEVEKVKYIFKDSSIKNHGEEISLAATQAQGVVPKNMLDFRTVEANVSDLNTFKLVKENNYVISLRSFEGGIEYSAYKGIISPAYTVMEALQDIEFKYFKYLFKSNIFILALNIYKTGIREGQNISFVKFKDDFLPFPPNNEQEKIAEYIEVQTTKIDKAIELQRNYITKLKEYRASLIDSVVTGKVRVV